MKKNFLLYFLLFFSAWSFAQNTPLRWDELGPANVGGRTRSLIIDKRDPTRATLYAGAVSGGLWKSTDRGNSWHPLLSVYSSCAVSCMTQDANGRIYFGTGEGLAEPYGSSRSSGSAGNGLHFLYGNDLDSIIPSTAPAYLSNSLPWALINRIAINPTNTNDLYAATSGGSAHGLMHTLDGGLTWIQVGSLSAQISGYTGNIITAADVKFSADGMNVFASIGGPFEGSNLIISNDGGATFRYSSDTTFPTIIARIEIATSPSNPQIAYLSVASSGSGSLCYVLKTIDAGLSWTKIGSPAGVLSSVFGVGGQGWYDNAITVSPNNSDKVYLGGIQLYSYSSLNGWSLASIYYGNATNPQWIKPDIHQIVFNDLDSNEMYICSEGGIFKSSNAISSFPTPSYSEMNNGYNTLENYSVAADINGNVLGGAEDYGSCLVDINNGSQNIYSGYGVYAEISQFDSNVFISGSYSGNEYRSNSRGAAWSNMFDAVIDPHGYFEPSVCGQPRGGGNAPFITAFWLTETKTATNNISKALFVDNVAHSSGDIVTMTSHIGQTFQEALTSSLPAGDTAYFVDRLESRLYFATSCGLWMTPDILDFTHTPRWFRITSSTDDVKSLTSSPTGDTIYFGTNGKVTSISGLNSVPFDSFPVGQDSIIMTRYTGVHQFTSTLGNSGRYIEGIDADIHDPNHVLCAVAGFSSPGTPHVYESRDGGTIWNPKHNNLPNIPVYQCLIDAYNPTHYILGTELGFWDSHDAGATWVEQNGGITVREPIYRLRQQHYHSDQCYVLYAGTHGRGMWRSTTITEAQAGCTVTPLGIDQTPISSSDMGMILYPNPMDGSGKVMITVSQAADITLVVSDIAGRVLMENSYNHMSEGKNTIDLQCSSLVNGSYIVSAKVSNGKTYSRTLIIAR